MQYLSPLFHRPVAKTPSALFCVLAIALTVVFWFSPPVQAAKEVPSTPMRAATPMLPHLDWLLDKDGKLTVEDMTAPERQAAFRPLDMRKLPLENGTVWLRFTLAGRPAEVRPATLLLDMGEGVPGTPTLYVSRHNVLTNTTEWQSFTPSQRSIFLMPESRSEAQTAYIRLEGMPGLWFSPELRTPHNAATSLERLARPALMVALGVIMLLCLLRGLTERGEWRVWTSAYTGAALFNVIWGIPSTVQGQVGMSSVAAVLAPGVALMLLPHVGRHLMRTSTLSRPIDIQYFLLSLPGAALALIPLLPGFSWTLRYLDLWPLGTLLLLPTTLGAWLIGLPGARRFLLGCLLPPAGVAVGLLGMGSAIPAPLLGTAPMWGLALGALIIAGTAAAQDHAAAPAAEAPAPTMLDDPALRIITQEELARENATLNIPDPEDGYADSRTLAMEEQLRTPLDALLRDGAALEQCALPPAARQLCESMLHTVRAMTGMVSLPAPDAPRAHGPAASCVFDLQEVLRQAHDAVSSAADNKNIALSWFMPPHLAQCYRGDAARIGQVLRMLLESAVRATSRGAVQLAVRRVPESVDPGHLLFSVTDTGAGTPPTDRSSLALVRAWELAGTHRGFLSLESSPLGASVSFTLRLDVATADTATPSPSAEALATAPGIILVDDSPSNRQLLSFFLEGLPFVVAEARSPEEALELHARTPARLLIVDADMPIDLPAAVGRIRDMERAENLAPAILMALSSDDNQWDGLRDAGFTHALPKPVTRAGLRATVCELLPQDDVVDNAVSASAPLSAAPTMPPLSFDQQNGGDDIIDTGMPLPEPETDAPLRMGQDDFSSATSTQGNLADMAEGLPQLPHPTTPQMENIPAQGGDMPPHMPELDLTPPTPVVTPVTATAVAPLTSEDTSTATFSPLRMTPDAPIPSRPSEMPNTLQMPDAPNAPERLDMPDRDAAAPVVAPEYAATPEPDQPHPLLTVTPGASPAPIVAPPVAGAAREDTASLLPPPQEEKEKPQEISEFSAPENVPAAEWQSAGNAVADNVPSITPTAEPTVAPTAEPAVAPTVMPNIAATAAADAEPSVRQENMPETQDKTNAAYLTSLLLDAPSPAAATPSPTPTVGALSGMFGGYGAPAERMEWVGEPMPIAKPRTADAQAVPPDAPQAAVPQSVFQSAEAPYRGQTSAAQSAPQTAPSAPATDPRPAQPVETPPVSAVSASANPWNSPFFGGTAAASSVEWVGEPMPIMKPKAAAPQDAPSAPTLSSAPAPAAAPAAKFFTPTPASIPAAAPASAIAAPVANDPPFVPLSFEPSAFTNNDAANDASAEHTRPSIMPQSVPLLDFIIADAPAGDAPQAGRPESAGVAQSSHAAPAPMSQPEPSSRLAQASSRLAQAFSPAQAPQSAQTAPSTRPAWGAPSKPAPTIPQGVAPARTPRYANVGEPMPLRMSASGPTANLPLDSLLEDFDRAAHDARLAYQKEDADGVRLAARHIAGQADNFGLRALARMARCVEDAAKAKDRDALGNLLPELETFVERNRIAMRGR